MLGKDHPHGCHFSEKFRHFVGSLKLQTVLIVALVIIVVAGIGITGFLTFLNSQYAVKDIAMQVENQVSDRIDLHLDMYLEMPHHINTLCSDSIRLGEIAITDNDALEKHFQELIYRYSAAEAICYGNEQEGNYTIISKVGAPGVANGTDLFLGFSRAETNFSFEEYRIDREGNKREKTVSLPDYDPRTRPWYTSAVAAGKPAWTPVYMWLEGVVGIDAVLPVYDEKGVLLGVLDTALTLTGIGDFLQSLQISRNGQAFIIDESGLLVASSTMKEPYTRKNGELVRISALESDDAGIRTAAGYIITHNLTPGNISEREQFSFDLGRDGGRQLVQVTPYEHQYGLNWLIVVIIPESDFMSGIEKSNQQTLILIIAAIIITIIICVFLSRWVTKPVAAMNESAKALAHGDWKSWKELDRHDELGELSHSFKLMADQLKESFSSLKMSEERYMSLFHSSADAIQVFNGYTLININLAGERMFRTSAEESVGKDIRTLFGTVGLSIGEIIESAMLMQNGGYQDRTISDIVEGKERFMNIRATRVLEEGSLLNLVHIRDITDQRLSIISFTEQEALRESYAHVRIILENLPDATFVVDKEGYVMYWNRAIENLTGVHAEDMIGRGFGVYSKAIFSMKRPLLLNLLLDPEIPGKDLYEHVERSGDTLTTSYWAELAGGLKYISVIASLLHDTDGSIMGAIESIRDITSLKMAEEALLMANKKLNLLSSITRHDIINKIMVSKGYLSLLDDTIESPEQKLLISSIVRSMADIDHFVAFTRTYQELGITVPVWHDVREACDQALRGINFGEIRINNTISGISILVDPLFEKVCYNLVENSIRHGEHVTHIDISAEETPEGLRISVSDDGVGVPEDQKVLIFERGFGKNTGYGLFLVREILSISGITISEHGVFGDGCRFDIDVPRGKFRMRGEMSS